MFDSLVLCDICMAEASIWCWSGRARCGYSKSYYCHTLTFYRMGNGIIFKLFHFCGYHARPFGEEDYRGRTSYIVFFEKTTDAYKILYDKRSLRHQFLYFLATLGRLYLFIILVVLIGYSFTLGKVGYILFLLLCGVLIFSVRWLIHLKSHFVRYFNLKVLSEEHFYPIFLKK